MVNSVGIQFDISLIVFIIEFFL